MKLRATTILAAAFLALVPVASFALPTYTQDFEALNAADPAALSSDGWLVYGNVFSPDHSTYYYGYGPFPAPNPGGGFSALVCCQGGAAQGNQQLSIYSDYNNGDHANGNLIEANVYREMTVGAGDVGNLWTFQFDAKRGSLAPPTAAVAFIKTLNPAAGWAMTNFITADMAVIPSTWGTYSLQILVDPSLVGQILQIGFATTTTGYAASGNFYDNLSFTYSTPTPTTTTSWGRLKGLYR